jgi:cytochrome c oxidase cbb3-type subunit 3
MFKFTFLAVFLISGSLLSVADAAPDGEKLYLKHCSVCHNDKGLGGIGLPLNGDKIDHFPREYLLKTIRLGRPGRVMPAFPYLSDAQVGAIADHVLSWKHREQEQTFAAGSVVGNVENGRKFFLRECADCHGPDGKSQGVGTGVTMSRERKFKVVPPALNNPGFLASAHDSWIRYTIVHGRPGTIMPSQKETGLSDDNIDDIVSYIRSFEQQYTQPEASEKEEPTLVFDSPYDFTTTVSNLKQSLQGMNFRYFPDRYMEMGLADDSIINKKQLSMRFCNFNQLYQIINTEPRLGVVLPCRITVVEQDDGSVKLYVMNMKLVSHFFNNEQMIKNAETMHENIMAVIDEATL